MKALPRLLAAAAALLALAGLLATLASWRGDVTLARLSGRASSSLSTRSFLALSREGSRQSPAAWIPLVPAAHALVLRGDDDAALELLEEALTRHAPLDARFLRAAIWAQKGRMRDALPELEAVHRLSPRNRTAVQYLLLLHASAGDLEKLAVVAEESERRFPGGFDALVALKNVALAHGDVRAAVLYARLALDARDRPEPRLYDPAEEREALAALEASR